MISKTRMRMGIFILLAMFILEVFNVRQAMAQIDRIPVYDVFEVELSASGNYDNPYLQMPADNNSPGFVVGCFSGPNGENVSIDGFWDGGTIWRIRMAPTAVGTWTYSTSSTDAGLDGHSGRIESVPSDSHGFLRVDPAHPNHFMWDDGTPFYWAGTSIILSHFDEAGRTTQGGDFRVDDGSFQTFLDLRAAQGFNVAYWGFYGFNKPQFEDRTQQNEGGPPFVDYDPDVLNPAYYQFGDQRVKAALERGFVPMFTLGWPDQGIMKYGHERLKRYWRYIIARYSAFNLTYNLFGEVQEFGDEWLEIANDYAQLTRQHDPNKHLLSTHSIPAALSPDLIAQPWYEYVILQLPTDETSDYADAGIPIVNAEYFGYENFQVTTEELRPLLWDVRMRGAYLVYEAWGTSDDGAVYAQIANSFFRLYTRFWLLEYHPELFGGRPGLADPGHEYVFYIQPNESVTVDLSDAREPLSVTWYDPNTGVLLCAPSGEPSRVEFFPPRQTEQDWVLWLHD